MLNISEIRNINFDNFFNLAKRSGVFINKNLEVREIKKNNNGIFAKKIIKPNEILISLPKNLFISQNIFENFISEKKVDYPNPEFLNIYFSSLPKFHYFKQTNFLFADEKTRIKIINLFIEQSPTRQRILNMFKKFDKLNDFEKYVFLNFKTRAFKFKKKSYLCPIVDLVNYKFGAEKAPYSEEKMFFKNTTLLNNSDEFFQGYESEYNIVSFYLNYNFIPENFNRITIPPNFFTINIPNNSKEKIDENYWTIYNGKISNKKSIVFENLSIPLDFKFEINQIISDSSLVKKVIISVLQMLRNEIKYDEVLNCLKESRTQIILSSFAKCLLINYKKIDLAIEKLNKN